MDAPERAKAKPAWLAHYPELKELGDSAWVSALAQMSPVEVSAGGVLLRAGDACREFPLLLRGTVRVFVRTETGREIVLYRLRPGELCILSLGSLLGHEPYPAEAVAETDLKAVTLPAERFQRVFEESSAFRGFVIDHLVRRLHETIMLVQEVAFERLDVRLACHLCQRFQEERVTALDITHQELAVELGTTREVTSRMLKELERRGCIRLRRGRIELVNETALRHTIPGGIPESPPG